MYKVYAQAGWGSVMVEALLQLAGLPYELVELDMRNRPADRQTLAAINPLVQLPTIVVPDGTVMTESGAIALKVSEDAPEAGLAPLTGDPQRAAYLRWHFFLTSTVYASFVIDDHPDRWVDGDAARADVIARGVAYRKDLWRIVEANAGEPWFLGDTFSTLDLFVSIMTRWSPRRDWFRADCPKLLAIALAVDGMPALAKLWQRNFGPDKEYQ